MTRGYEYPGNFGRTVILGALGNFVWPVLVCVGAFTEALESTRKLFAMYALPD
jgi:hypothetical protein